MVLVGIMVGLSIAKREILVEMVLGHFRKYQKRRKKLAKTRASCLFSFRGNKSSLVVISLSVSSIAINSGWSRIKIKVTFKIAVNRLSQKKDHLS